MVTLNFMSRSFYSTLSPPPPSLNSYTSSNQAMQLAKLLNLLPSLQTSPDVNQIISSPKKPNRELLKHWAVALGLVMALTIAIVFCERVLYDVYRLPFSRMSDNTARVLDACSGRKLYVYELPGTFNQDLLNRCLREANSLCGDLGNAGRGSRVDMNGPYRAGDLILEPAHAWYRTEQFSLEILFHERVKRYQCLTQQAQHADAFYIPYYAALDTAFTLFAPQLHARDEVAQQLVGWLSGSRVWAEYGLTRPHFMALGRTVWEFSRPSDVADGWGTLLLKLPSLSSVKALVIERDPYGEDRVMAIPYPTSFHPSSDRQMQNWQESVILHNRRPWLCTFIGSAQRGRTLRSELVRQCEQSSLCRLMSCGSGIPGTIACEKRPEQLIGLFWNATFCLQPPGDSPTRKGIFDSLLAGCIPVLFSEHSAYTQYKWHLPRNGSLYSVFLKGSDVAEGKVDVMATLAELAKDSERLQRMREAIAGLLPSIVYRSADAATAVSHASFRDAVDVALDHVFAAATSRTTD